LGFYHFVVDSMVFNNKILASIIVFFHFPLLPS
jgi:hypothetical protein